MTDVKTSANRLSNHGQIASMDLPAGWVEGPARTYTGAGTRSFRAFHSPDIPEAKLCFYYRGLPVQPESAQTFREVLGKPPHMLDESEISALSEVLRDRGNSEQFQMRDIRTEDLNGRRVLVVEGTYDKIQQDTYALCIDADGSGRFVQEIYYLAPFIDFVSFKAEADEAIKSIAWK